MSLPQLPKNLARAVDLSALAQPKSSPTGGIGIPVTAENLMQDFLAVSNSEVVILVCWSPRSAQSQQVLQLMAAAHTADQAATGQAPWRFGSVNVDAEAAVGQALQVQAVPLAIAIIQEQLVPLFESVPTEAQIRLVIEKVLTLAAERGIGTAPIPTEIAEPIAEPEEEIAMAALEAGDFTAAKAAYEAWLARSPFDPLAKLGLAQTELFIRTLGVDVKDIYAKSAAQPSSLKLALLAADLEVMHGENQLAFDRIIAFIKESDATETKIAKDHLLALFSLVDPEDPILIKARQALASALF